MAVMLHITSRRRWRDAQASGAYTAPSLETQGFIHCSTREQVVAVANFLFRGQRDLLLLCIETERLDVNVRYENLEGGQKLFPHVYGSINTEAVVDVLEFPVQEDGTFKLPKSLAHL